jgi:hypothetical protein
MERKDIVVELRNRGIKFNPAAKAEKLQELLDKAVEAEGKGASEPKKGEPAKAIKQPKLVDGQVAVTIKKPCKAAGSFRGVGERAILDACLAKECVDAGLAEYEGGTPAQAEPAPAASTESDTTGENGAQGPENAPGGTTEGEQE